MRAQSPLNPAPVALGRLSMSTYGWLALAAGLTGAASGFLLLVVPKEVTDDRYSYPLEAAPFIAIQIWFGVHHFGLLAGQQGLWMAGAIGRGRAARIGHGLAMAGMVLLIATEFLATSAAESPYPSTRTNILDALYGISTTAVGIGYVVAGVTALRHGTFEGWPRWLPLALGGYVVVPMFPALMSGFIGARLGVVGWMLLYALVGLALLRYASAQRGE